MVRLLLSALLASGCAVSCEPPPAARREPAEPPASAAVWPEAVVQDLPLATPATRVTLRADSIAVSNEELVASWPAAALEQARTESGAEPANWPRIDVTLASPAVDRLRIPALETELSRARRAERAATGSGTGAGTFDLQVERAVPMAEVQRVLYTAAQAGYGTPRIVLTDGTQERVLPWPPAPPRRAPSREEIAAALASPETLTAPPSSELRLELTADRLSLGQDELAFERAALERRIEADGPVTLSVALDVPFARVATVLQWLGRNRPVRLLVRGAP